MKRPPPLMIYKTPGRREAVIVLTFEALGKERADNIWNVLGPSYPGGGVSGPGFRADYLCDLKAVPGERIITEWDERLNVGIFATDKVRRYVLTFDFGGTLKSKTAILAAYQLPYQIRIFQEFVPPPLSTRIIKERLRDKLRVSMPWLKEDFEWADFFDAVGDCSGVGYKLDYGDSPWRIQIINPSNDPNWRSRGANQALLNSSCAKAKRCCFKEFPDSTEKCDVCQRKLEMLPGLVVHERCQVLIDQIPAAVRDENGVEDKSAPHDAFDAALYLVRWLQRTHDTMRRTVEEKRPWYARGEQKSKGPLSEDQEMQKHWLGKKQGTWV